jgi:L,D-transpeptidase YcbB
MIGKGRLAALVRLGSIGLMAAAAAPVATQTTSASYRISPVTTQWSADAARDLVTAVKASRAEGLRPSDYGLARLEAALERGSGAELDAVASPAALALARDYAFGRVSDREALGWHMDADANRMNALMSGLAQAVASGEVRSFMNGLLPTGERYRALRAALPAAPSVEERDRIRANMERWRWMPRELGDNYLYVNVPSYRLQVMEAGTAMSTYTVVVGAKDTPTPMMVTPASSVVVNPWWNVPQSIVKSSGMRPGRGGYIWKANSNGGWQVRQPPGPRNALGRLKINLANDHAIYLHDTPAKSGFTREERALSHGCIRVKDVDRLASELMMEGGDPAMLEEALAGRETTTLRLPKSWPVYLVYFTADLDESGRLVTYADPYEQDAALIARLDGQPAGRGGGGITIAAR